MVITPVAASNTIKSGALVIVKSAYPQVAVDHETPAASFPRSFETVKVVAAAPVIIAAVAPVGAVVIGTHVLTAQSALTYTVTAVSLVTVE
jgi:hypothetical protein